MGVRGVPIGVVITGSTTSDFMQLVKLIKYLKGEYPTADIDSVEMFLLSRFIPAFALP